MFFRIGSFFFPVPQRKRLVYSIIMVSRPGPKHHHCHLFIIWLLVWNLKQYGGQSGMYHVKDRKTNPIFNSLHISSLNQTLPRLPTRCGTCFFASTVVPRWAPTGTLRRIPEEWDTGPTKWQQINIHIFGDGFCSSKSWRTIRIILFTANEFKWIKSSLFILSNKLVKSITVSFHWSLFISETCGRPPLATLPHLQCRCSLPVIFWRGAWAFFPTEFILFVSVSCMFFQRLMMFGVWCYKFWSHSSSSSSSSWELPSSHPRSNGTSHDFRYSTFSGNVDAKHSHGITVYCTGTCNPDFKSLHIPLL